LLRSLQQELGVDGGGKGGDDDGGDILKRDAAIAFFRFAGELPVFARERAIWSIDADDVVGHGKATNFSVVWRI